MESEAVWEEEKKERGGVRGGQKHLRFYLNE